MIFVESDLSKELTKGVQCRGYPFITILEQVGQDIVHYTEMGPDKQCHRFAIRVENGATWRTGVVINDPPDIEEYNAQYKCDYYKDRIHPLMHEILYDLDVRYKTSYL